MVHHLTRGTFAPPTTGGLGITLTLLLAVGLCLVPASGQAAGQADKDAKQVHTPWKWDAAAMRPFWQSRTMVGEPVLFVKAGDGPAEGRLLFTPTRIVSVRSPSGEMVYASGKDYAWVPGTDRITLPAGSRIVWKTPQDLLRPAGSQPYALTSRTGGGEIMFGATHEYHDLQTMVTYEHKPGQWAGPSPAFAGKQLPRTLARLNTHQPVTVALLGDSISTGCNASGWAHVPPYQPPYQDLLVQSLSRAYGAEVTLRNFAVGGTDTAWGVANIGEVTAVQPDLLILAFGMNDSGGRPAAEYQANIRKMVEAVRRARPEAEFVLVSTMTGNADWTALHQELFPEYRDALRALCGPGVVLADMTSVWLEMLRRKPYRDLTGNGVNHPNDFGHRVYAQVLGTLLIEPKQQPR